MAYILDPNFALSEAPPSEVEEIFRVMERAFSSDEVYGEAIRKCDPEETHQWLMKYLAPRWTFPDITMYKVTEVATGYYKCPYFFLRIL
jgi:hypothetical protein